MLLITLFSILATLLTFVYLKPFLAHPWFHLAYWLLMYLILFFGAPVVFLTHERKYGGRLPVEIPLNGFGRLVAGGSLLISLVCGLGMLFNIETVNQVWPWTMPPLVGGLIGVLFTTHTVAFGWSLWDGDWLRVRPMFWQAPITAFLLMLLPLIHPADLRPDAGPGLVLFYGLSGLMLLSHLGAILSHRPAEKRLVSDGG
jgi:hypothetical protein